MKKRIVTNGTHIIHIPSRKLVELAERKQAVYERIQDEEVRKVDRLLKKYFKVMSQ